LVVTLSMLLHGCGGGHRERLDPAAGYPTVTASCNQPRSLARAPLPQQTGVYRAGPLLLVTGEDLAQLPDAQLGHRFGMHAIVLVSGARPVVLSVDRAAPVNISLRFAKAAAGPGDAIRFPACGGRLRGFGGGIEFSGEGCARLHVSRAGGPAKPLLIPIGNTLSGCPSTKASVRLAPSALPFLGVACHVPNAIGCDRVGVGVDLGGAGATLVVAEVAGRYVTLSPPTDPGDHLWLGYLRNAGLRQGALAVGIPRRATRWLGNPEVDPPVAVKVFFEDGTVASLAALGFLHPGFG
jgi:hypothetical protein